MPRTVISLPSEEKERLLTKDELLTEELGTFAIDSQDDLIIVAFNSAAVNNRTLLWITRSGPIHVFTGYSDQRQFRVLTTGSVTFHA